MIMKYNSLIFIAFLIIGSCSTWKKSLHQNGKQNQAIENSIIDFLNSSSLSKNDSVFSIKINDKKNLIIVSILATYNKVLPNSKTKIGFSTTAIPTKYIERNRNLFYWNDSSAVLTNDMIAKLSKYRIIDSMNVNGFVGIPETTHVDDSKKGIDYFICKNNFLKYKKVTTNNAFDYSDIPNVNCNGN